MGKHSDTQQLVGIDVSGKTLQVAHQVLDGLIRDFEVTNDAEGHKLLVAEITKDSGSARVCVEATGNFSLDLSLTLSRHARIELMVVNPQGRAQVRRGANASGEDR